MMNSDIAVSRAVGSRGFLVAFMGILIAGSALRLAFLGQQPFHVDEAYSFWFANRSWQYLWGVVPQIELHPPFYYSILKIGRAFGPEEWVMRLPSALISIATLPIVYLAAREIGGPGKGRTVGLAAMLICAVAPFQIDRAQEGRSYAFWFFAIALCIAALAWLARNPQTACLPLRRWLRLPGAAAAFAGLAIGLSLLMWFHNIGAIYAASIAIFCLVWWFVYLRRDPRAFLNLLLVALVAVLLYGPNLPTLFEQTGRASEAQFYMADVPGPGLFFRKVFNAIGITAYAPLRHRYIMAFNLVAALCAVAGLAVLVRRDRGVFAVLLLSFTLLPVTLIFLVTYTMKPILETPTAGPTALPWYMLLASSALLFRGSKLPATIAAAVGALYATGLPGYYLDTIRKEPWDRIVRLMGRESTGSGLVITVPNEAALALDYYVSKQRRNLKVVALPGPYPFRGLPPFPTPLGNGSAGIDAFAVDVLRRTVAAQDPEWLVTRALVWFDPDDRVRRFLAGRYCLTRYDLGMYPYIGVYRLSRRSARTADGCTAVRVSRSPVCGEFVTSISRGPLGCIGAASESTACYGTMLRCRLDYR